MSEIRRATLEDVPACARIVFDWEAETGYLGKRMDLRVIERHIAEAFAQREMWVSGDPVRGYMSIDPETHKLGAIYMTHRGTGLGKRFIDFAKSRHPFLWLTVFELNTRAQAFYRREGFRFTDRVPRADPPKLGEPVVLRMDWARAEALA